MYTQCPDCSTAFRITAEVLKQAAGKVRCGGCGIAFNALDYLSEQRPASAAAAAGHGRSGGRRPGKAPSLEAADAPTTITPARSAALLKTLDQLAGSDNVRIEDTGVEWRVLDESEADEVGDDSGADSGSVRTIENTGSMRFVIADNDGAASGEMRFDDNTPLPDDFDFDEEPAAPPPLPEPVVEVPDVDSAQADLALGEPEEWQDLLGEVQGPPEGVGERRDPAASSDAQRSLAAELASLRSGDDDSPSSIDEQFAMQAEAMGIDISGAYRKAVAAQQDVEPRDIEDSSIDDDLISAAFETEQRQRLEQAATLAEDVADDATEAIELEAADDATEAIELEAADDDDDHEEKEDSLDLELDASSTDNQPLDMELDDSGAYEALDIELDDSGSHEALDMEFAAEDDDEDEAVDIELVAGDEDAGEPDIPPLSEEELTINKMIDEELLAIAVEDEEGFASTIVQIQPVEEIKPLEAVAEDDSDTGAAADVFSDNPLVETIIMEGESIRDEAEERALEKARRRKEADKRKIEEAHRRQEAEAQAQEEARRKRRNRNRTVAGIAVLAVLLVLQALHFSREALATNPAYQKLIAPIYRLFGQDVIPAWNVRGWRFEVTNGSTAAGNDRLTIYTRIGNKSRAALPYPLISVSLTDRYEETIGSSVLGPDAYLGADADTRALVGPDGTFDAMITIESTEAEAVGFKLNVCYAYEGDRLRCAVEDFR